MAEEVLYKGPVTDVAALLAAFKFPENAYVLVENMPMHIVKDKDRQNLLYFAHWSDIGKQKDPIKVADYTSGRIFAGNFELRWEQLSGKIQAVYLGERKMYEDAPHALSGLESDETTLKNLERREKSTDYYLFGQFLAEQDRQDMLLEPAEQGMAYFAEVRIPRLLCYPISAPGKDSKKQRVKLVVQEYASKETGRVEFFRFSGLVPTE